jgi:hypothetical protein
MPDNVAAALTTEEATTLDRYWRTANYLAACQIYLMGNPLLRQPLRPEHIKPRADCAANTTDQSCHVATIVISPSTPAGTTSATLFNHYSLLGTAEQLLGLPMPGLAASYPTMTQAFKL